MGILWAQDVRNKIITRLTDGTAGINAQLTAINTARSTNTELPIYIAPEADEGMFPSIYIDLGDSVINEVRASVENLWEVIETQVSAIVKRTNSEDARQDGENYLEAIIKCLQNYEYRDQDGTFYIIASGMIRADLDTSQEQTTRGVSVIFSVHRNKF